MYHTKSFKLVHFAAALYQVHCHAPSSSSTAFSLWKRIKCFSSTLRRRNITGRSIKNTRAKNDRKACYHKCLHLFSKRFTFTLKFKFLGFEKFFRKALILWFCVRLLWTAGLTVEIKLRVQISLAYYLWTGPQYKLSLSLNRPCYSFYELTSIFENGNELTLVGTIRVQKFCKSSPIVDKPLDGEVLI